MKIFKKIIIIFIGIIQLLSLAAFARPKSGECTAIIEQLRQMNVAQSSVQRSLILNHEMMAQSLESYSEALSESAGRAHKAISENMAKASGSLRQRGLKAQDISKKLESNTDDLIKSVEKCLK